MCTKQKIPNHFTRKYLSVTILLFTLLACNNQTEPPVTDPNEPGGNPISPPAQGRTLTTWTVDSEFSVDAISDPQTRAWYRQMGVEIAQENAVTCPPDNVPPEDQESYPASGTTAACSAIKHFVGRGLNYYVTSLLSVFRLTGDRALLEEVDRVLETARARLRDTDGDGYRNWFYLASIDDDDFNLKEDSLSHGFLAQAAYAFRQNAAYSTPEHDYAAHADAWTAYLRSDFEGKWAGRASTAQTEGVPVHRLFHPFMEILRYHVYMAKLFPDDPKYQRMHERLAQVALTEFRTDVTPNGPAFVWSHPVRQWDPEIRGDPNHCTVFQMGTYPQQTMLAFFDLALEGYPGFADPVALQKLSRTLSESILQPTEFEFLYKDVGGPRNGYLESGRRKDTIIDGWCFQDASFNNGGAPTENFRSKGSYQALPWAFLATFAPESQGNLESGEIYLASQQVYGNPLDGPVAAKRVYVPAALAFARLYHAGSFSVR